jgi:hypothetical protein
MRVQELRGARRAAVRQHLLVRPGSREARRSRLRAPFVRERLCMPRRMGLPARRRRKRCPRVRAACVQERPRLRVRLVRERRVRADTRLLLCGDRRAMSGLRGNHAASRRGVQATTISP